MITKTFASTPLLETWLNILSPFLETIGDPPSAWLKLQTLNLPQPLLPPLPRPHSAWLSPPPFVAPLPRGGSRGEGVLGDPQTS